MEKGTPHCKLPVVKAPVQSGQVRTTRSAREGAVAPGLDFDGMLAVVLALESADFYKSMTPTQTAACGRTSTVQ
jgi:motility quorum-sensing regulator/GCU-specific mRNA interferase toxin